jgi:hypothetical protein
VLVEQSVRACGCGATAALGVEVEVERGRVVDDADVAVVVDQPVALVAVDVPGEQVGEPDQPARVGFGEGVVKVVIAVRVGLFQFLPGAARALPI